LEAEIDQAEEESGGGDGKEDVEDLGISALLSPHQPLRLTHPDARDIGMQTPDDEMAVRITKTTAEAPHYVLEAIEFMKHSSKRSPYRIYQGCHQGTSKSTQIDTFLRARLYNERRK
jgi:hypothetical protein